MIFKYLDFFLSNGVDLLSMVNPWDNAGIHNIKMAYNWSKYV